jgi:hypothetical protein
LGFSSTRKTIDNSPGWRYSSDQKKRLFKFPIRVPILRGEIQAQHPFQRVRGFNTQA